MPYISSIFYVAGPLLSRDPLLFFSLQKINLKYPSEVGERIWGSNCFLQTFKHSFCSQSLPHLHFWFYLLCPIPESLAVLPCKKLSCFLLSHRMSVGIQVTQVCQVSGFSHRCFTGSYALLLLSFLCSL